jgi:glycosyltransferase involved in cell wall biosynthesis
MPETPQHKTAVCVAVPVHNGAATLEQCLECLRKQTLTNIRVLIFENASTDDTRKIAERFCRQDARFELRTSEALLPVLENHKRAIEQGAQISKYFCLRAADDFTSLNYLEVLADALDQQPSIHLASGHVQYVSKNGELTHPRKDLESIFVGDTENKVLKSYFPASWYYGLYRSGRATEYLSSSKTLFPFAWGNDRLVIFKMICDFGFFFSSNATFFCQLGSDSAEKYTPKGFSKKLSVRAAYYRQISTFSGWPDSRLKKAILAWSISGRHTGTKFKFGRSKRKIS